MSDVVKAWSEPVVIPTYEPAAPDKNPMFLEKRVYQGSSGKVYPLPFYDRIAETKTDRTWQALHIENEFIYAMILPEMGGRIHIGRDKTNGYDFFYRQNVIKPALVGLAGPWCSGGVEFNWPQHHRPATFMPVDWTIEEHADGSKTIWLSDHDPMARMKGMHGVCIHPGRSFIELKVRAYNRTPFVQTFLWWANVATRVHEQYQSFFPPDVYYIADHAKRAMSEYPLCKGRYYGVDYGTRGKHGVPKSETPSNFAPPGTYAPNDLSWYANIPVPTSYMCMGSKEDFFGGYDHAKRAGVVHIADHRIAPGKKQWTWGNHDFGYAWDRNLTDEDGPYIELMAGVFTDNQPDFSFLMPGETRTWSQYWYPIREIGPAQHANLDAAISLFGVPASAGPKRSLKAGHQTKTRIGVSVSRVFKGAEVSLIAKGEMLKRFTRDLSPGSPFVEDVALPRGVKETDLRVDVSCDGREIISFQPKPRVKGKVPPPATEPPAPEEISSADELFITGLHLDQYRHATRCPTLYWREALRRDPMDSRCNNATGHWHLKRGEFAMAEKFFRAAIERLTRRNPNPYDGEAYYNLGLCLRFLGRDDDAYDEFYKATWNQGWQAAAFHALAEIDCCRDEWPRALDHLDRSLKMNTDNLRARNMKAMVLRKLGNEDYAYKVLDENRAMDSLDWWSRHLTGEKIACDGQTSLDLAIDFSRAGFFEEAIEVLEVARRDAGVSPMIEYYLGSLYGKIGDKPASLAHFRKAASLPPDYCFPSRLEDIAVLEAAMRANPKDPRAPYYLGNLLYDKRRHDEAIKLWAKSAGLDGSNSVVWRNLGIGYFNIRKKPKLARAFYDKALRVNPGDARLLYERDQLWKRLGVSPAKRLAELEKRRDLVARRDDLSVEICALWNQTGQHAKALELLSSRKFQPWEGGEGAALGQFKRTHLALGRAALAKRNPGDAAIHFETALEAPKNLGEAWHLLQNQSDTHYWLGVALEACGDALGAKNHWRIAAEFRGDFQEMSVRAFSEMTYFSALSLERLGRKAEAKKLLRELDRYARQLEKTPAKIDYFATSLPTMLLFEDDLQARQTTAARFMQAQAALGLGHVADAKRLLKDVLRRDPSHAAAVDLLKEMTR